MTFDTVSIVLFVGFFIGFWVWAIRDFIRECRRIELWCREPLTEIERKNVEEYRSRRHSHKKTNNDGISAETALTVGLICLSSDTSDDNGSDGD